MKRRRGDVRIRSNVTSDPGAWHLVPGELLHEWRPHVMQLGGSATPLQRDQHMYHQPCGCGRRLFEIEVYGCNECPFTPRPSELERNLRDWERTIERIRELERDEQAAIEAERTGGDGRS